MAKEVEDKGRSWHATSITGMIAQKIPVRLYIRIEGEWLNAYICKLDSTWDSDLLGSLSLRLSKRLSPEVVEVFIDVMKMAFDQHIKKQFHPSARIDPTEAPQGGAPKGPRK